MALENHPYWLTTLVAVFESLSELALLGSVMIFMVREGFKTLLNICMVKGLSCILVHDLRILNSLMTSSAVHPPCFMVSSLQKDSSTWSSLAKFS